MRNIREQRLSRNWTQKALSEKSGVSLSTLRKFERTGKISLESFVKICFCLDLLDKLIKVTEPRSQEFTSMDQVLEKSATKKRQRARGK
ncbi:helix-turn-helix transcriptional regulator [Desulfovibrio sp. JC022]|uniref:helix-turn-helix domain-containing protein n=1 Tax=Desulfovibrio sp. JC022 TaxID=2593642 RepID=UPI0013D2D4B8|nr:helix-turn-helix transcriptional regulator [Desulfovibrio sp. JC022]